MPGSGSARSPRCPTEKLNSIVPVRPRSCWMCAARWAKNQNKRWNFCFYPGVNKSSTSTKSNQLPTVVWRLPRSGCSQARSSCDGRGSGEKFHCRVRPNPAWRQAIFRNYSHHCRWDIMCSCTVRRKALKGERYTLAVWKGMIYGWCGWEEPKLKFTLPMASALWVPVD